MRLILIGTEYVGKTTLANALQEWGLKVGKRFHMDDGDFTILDYHHLNEEDQQTMWNMSPVLKERFQRMVIYYHLEILERYNDCIFGGFHIEEKIFGPRYYHPGSEVSYHRWLEHKMPDNCILVHMTCDPDVIRQRMVDDPHPYELVKSHEIEEIMEEFLYEYNNSYFRQKVEFDTPHLTPEGILEPFLEAWRRRLAPPRQVRRPVPTQRVTGEHLGVERGVPRVDARLGQPAGGLGYPFHQGHDGGPGIRGALRPASRTPTGSRETAARRGPRRARFRPSCTR